MVSLDVSSLFCIIKKRTEEEFPEFNRIRPNIKFNLELESNNTLPFLDCLITEKRGVACMYTGNQQNRPIPTLQFSPSHPCQKGIGKVLI